jgi:hypothetical protein
MAQLSHLQEQVEQERGDLRPPLQMSSCRFSETDVDAWEALYSSEEFSWKKVSNMRAEATSTPPCDGRSRAGGL